RRRRQRRTRPRCHPRCAGSASSEKGVEMTTASCRCGQLSVAATGEPVRISVCHCLDCKRRSGSSFAAQARFPAETVQVSGESHAYAHRGNEGKVTHFHFCPACGGN